MENEVKTSPFTIFLALAAFIAVPLPALAVVAVMLLFKLCGVSNTLRRILCLALSALCGWIFYEGIDKEALLAYSGIHMVRQYLAEGTVTLPETIGPDAIFLFSVVFLVLQVTDQVFRAQAERRALIAASLAGTDVVPADLVRALGEKEGDPGLGVLLGATRDGIPRYVAPEELAKHCMLIGSAGDERIAAVCRFAEHAIQAGGACVFIDGRGGSAFLREVKRIAEQCGRPVRSFTMNAADGGELYDPFAGSAQAQLVDKITTLSGWSGEHGRMSCRRFLQLLFRALDVMGIRPGFASMRHFCRIDSLIRELAEHKGDGSSKDEVRDILDSLPTIDTDMVKRLASLLGILSEGDMSGLFGGGIDLGTILKEREIALFSLDCGNRPDQTRLLGRLVIGDMKTRLRAIDTRQRVSLIFEDLCAYASPQVAEIIKKSSGASVDALFSFSSMSEVSLVEGGGGLSYQIAKHCDTLIAQRQDTAQDAEELAMAFRAREPLARFAAQENSRADAANAGNDAREFVFHPDDIRRLRSGEVLLNRGGRAAGFERVFVVPLRDKKKAD